MSLNNLHILKIWPLPFEAVTSGQKRYEIRKYDRDFKIGDNVLLKEYIPELNVYTGKMFLGEITYLTLPGTWGLSGNLCVFGFNEVK